MLASLRPLSPLLFGLNPRSQQPYLLYPGHTSDRAEQSKLAHMEGFGVQRFTTTPPPPQRQVPPPHHKLGSNSYATDAAQDAMEQRPSPQSRQRSWHHPYPYMPSARAFHGLSPPASLEPGAGPSSRPYDHPPHDAAMADPRQRSPPRRSEHLHAAPLPLSRPRAGSRAELVARAQPLNILPRPTYPQAVERIGGIGPSRNRGRSSTLSLPHPETTRVRGSSFIGGVRHPSPSNGPHGGYDESVPPPPRSWEEVRSHRDVFPHEHAREPVAAARRSPLLRPSSRQSSVLFAPLSPKHDPHLQLPATRVSSQMNAQLANPSVMSRGPHYTSRPGTPISPLNMDNLSMEDSYLPSASGMAVPVTGGQQRSPADARARSDYFGPASTEWSRSGHAAAEKGGSPRSGPYTPGPRHDPREHAYRASAMLHPEGFSPGTEAARYPPAPYSAGQQPPLQPTLGSVGALSGVHPGMSRAEQIERERFAMAQHHASFQHGYHHGPGGPQDLGYQSEFAPQQGRMSHGGGFGGNPQHAVPVDRIAHSRRRRRPPYSYSSMITQAISSSPEGRMTLREIYTWISTNFSGYPMSGSDSQGWQNTVRHNLSLGKIFIKKARTAQDIYDSCSSGNPSQSQAARGKGGWWTLHPVVLSQIRSGQRTHNDEFDDLERLVEIENAAASSKAGGVSASIVAASPTASANDAKVQRRLSADVSVSKSLNRQRSYSDSLKPAQVEQRRPHSSQQSFTAPVSRQGSMAAHRNVPVERFAYAARAAPLAEHGVSSTSSSSREDMPSVLQRTFDLEDDERAPAYNRMRGHTIAAHETPSHQYASKHEGNDLGRESYAPSSTTSSSRLRLGSAASPRLLMQDRAPMVEDVDMEPSEASHRDSSLVLQEARKSLVSAKQHQQHQQLLHRDAEARAAASATASAVESPEGAGRMAIRGLLNS